MTNVWFQEWNQTPVGFTNSVNKRPWFYNVDSATDHYNSLMEFKTTDIVLDTGCGNGMMAKSIYDKFSPYEMNLADYSENMVRSATELLKGYKNIGIVNATTDNLPYINNHFTKIICVGVMQYYDSLDEAKKCVAELYRVCAPGGKILLGDMINSKLCERKSGLWGCLPQDLGVGYKYIAQKSFFEPERRFEMVITK